MNRRERVLAAFNKQPVDRLPFSFWFHFTREEEKIDALADPSILTTLQEGHKRFFDEVKPDFVKVMCDGLFRYPSEPLYTFKSAADLAEVEVVGRNHPWIQAHIKNALQASAQSEESVYIYNIFSPSMLIRLLQGEERFMAAFKDNPAKMSDAVKRMSDGTVNLVQALMQDGNVDGIYYCVQNQNIDIISDEEHEKYFGEADRQVLLAANEINDCSILHVCGYEGRRNHLEKWTSYPSKAVNWAVHVEHVPLATGRDIFGDRCIVGGFQNTRDGVLYTGTEAEIKAEVRKMVQEMGRDGFVVACDCSLPFDIDWQHLVWVREELEAIG